MFTIVQYESIIGGLWFETAALVDSEQYEKWFKENLQEVIITHDEMTNQQFMRDSINEEDIMVKLYPQYPAGVTRTIYMIADYHIYGQTTIISLILGLIIGTAIYMLLDTDKKGLVLAILIYVLSFVILGFVQGFLNITGENLTLLDIWMFPDEFIIPVSITFALVVIVRFIKQKDIAKKLNEKLKAIKEEKVNK